MTISICVTRWNVIIISFLFRVNKSLSQRQTSFGIIKTVLFCILILTKCIRTEATFFFQLYCQCMASKESFGRLRYKCFYGLNFVFAILPDFFLSLNRFRFQEFHMKINVCNCLFVRIFFCHHFISYDTATALSVVKQCKCKSKPIAKQLPANIRVLQFIRQNYIHFSTTTELNASCLKVIQGYVYVSREIIIIHAQWANDIFRSK